MQPQDVLAEQNPLAAHYRAFRVSERLLLTGHSHQAWPDCSLAGQTRAWRDAAEHVDRKWRLAFARAEEVRRGFARLLEDGEGAYALAPSTHDLLVRFLFALPLSRRPRLVTTDGEFHSLRRQLARLEEEGIEVVRVPSRPAQDAGARLAAAVDGRTAAVMASAVFFDSGQVAGGLEALPPACARAGAELFVDAYHALNVMPFALRTLGLERAFVVGGGYKYCQLGEGNCFLRFPRDCTLRPVVTGWFADFEGLEQAPGRGPVGYAKGDARFAGSTYDPSSHYRASEVFSFFAQQRLTPAFLREVSQLQVGLLAREFDALDLDPAVLTRDRSVPLARLGGFLALSGPRAGALCTRLYERGVLADARGESLRLGPAPYLSGRQLRDAIGILGEEARAL